MDPNPDAAIGALRSRGLDSLPPLAIVLGSGLGAFADEARTRPRSRISTFRASRSRASKATPDDWWSE